MSTEKLSELKAAAAKYSVASNAHRENPTDKVALYAWDEATTEFSRVVGHNELEIIIALLAELEDERTSRELWQQNCIRAEERIAKLEAGAVTAPPAPVVQDGWIACSERMPEPNKYVQVSNGVWIGIGMYNDAEQFEDDEHWQDEHNEFIDLLHHPITHWMPLPAVPEVRRDDA